MPATLIFFDITLRKFTDAAGVTLTSLTAKRGDRRKYELGLRNNGFPTDIPDAATLRITVKDPAAITASTPLATATGSKSGFAGFARWIFNLNLNTAELTTRMGSAATATLTSELEVTLLDETISSGAMPFVVENDAWRGDEDAPTPANNGLANVMGVVIHGAVAGTARPPGFTVVTWIGSVEPTNALDNDIWEELS